MEENNQKTERVVEIRKGENSATVPTVKPVMVARAPKKEYSPMVKAVRSVCFWVMILSTVLLAALCVVSIWTEVSDIIGKAWGTFLVVISASAFIAVIVPLLDKNEE